MRLTWPRAVSALICLCFAVAGPATAGAFLAPSVPLAVAAAAQDGKTPCDSTGKALPAAKVGSVPAVDSGAKTAAAAPEAVTPKPHSNAGATIAGVPKGSDPFLAAVLGALPLASGYYLTSTPEKGLIFTLADVLLIGAIAEVRSDKEANHADVGVYYLCMGAVNLSDLVLSVWQVKSDNARRLSVLLNPPGRPGITVAWHL